MTSHSLRERLFDNQCLFGLCQMYPGAGIVEGMCNGWDLVWIDGQHGQIDRIAALDSIRAARSMNLHTLLRAPNDEPGILGLFADLAPSALMIPMVNTAEQAARIAAAVRFPPLGQRSYGGRRPIDLLGRGYYETQNLFVVAQIETLPAVGNACAIAAVDGIDMLFFGGDDMKLSMGVSIDMPLHEDARLQDAMAAMANAAREAGKYSACVAATSAAVQLAIDLGYELIIAGSDAGFIRQGSAERLSDIKKNLKKDNEKPFQLY